MRYSAGMLTEYVELRRAVSTPDGHGGEVRVFQALTNCWAYIEPQGGAEVVRAQRVEQANKYLVVVHVQHDVRPDDVIAWTPSQPAISPTYLLNVRGIKITPRSPWVELQCEQGAAS